VAKIFISYSRKDRPLAEAIAAQLTALGGDVWWDSNLLGGEDYRKKTAGIIAEAAAAIVIWSRRSVDSEWVVGEASAARERKILIPVNADSSSPPLDFRSINTIDMSQWVPGDPLPAMLTKAIGEKIGHPIGEQIDGNGGNARQQGVGRFSKIVARSWYADFECLLFSFIAQGFAAALTNIPLAIHRADLNPLMAVGIALLNSIVTGAVIMRPALAGKRLSVAIPWFGAAALTGVAGYYLTAALWSALELNEYLTFVGFWSLGLVLVLDAARRTAPNA
jgi:hypothetical protein